MTNKKIELDLNTWIKELYALEDLFNCGSVKSW